MRRGGAPRAPARRPFDLVLFDLDGTLLETAPEIADAVNDALRSLGLPPVDDDFVTRTIGHGGTALLRRTLERPPDAARGGEGPNPRAAGFDPSALPALSAAFERAAAARCGTRSRPYPQAIELLDALRADGVALALVTNKERRSTERLLRAHALDGRFDRVVCGDDPALAPKPDPAGVLDCLRTFAVEAPRALFVGDSAIDAATARAAGIAVWLLPHGYNGGQPVAQAAPDRVLPDLAAVRTALQGAAADR